MKTIYVTSSSHWDREWYQPFEHYRGRLVRMIDKLLDILENDSEYRYFHFDGQTIMIEDYIRIRPQNRERLHKLIKDGRILIGPWYTMPDEFLISGEGLVRNLQRGAVDCADLGVQANKNGYVCDIFGHNSQMPQIFAGFGIDNFTFFRGQTGYGKDNFLWKGADGTKAIAHKLHPDYAYSSFFFVARWSEKELYDDAVIVERIQRYLEREEPSMAADCHLMIDGVDHIDAEKELPRILQLLNANIKGYTFVHSNMEDYTAHVRKNIDKLDTIDGVMYDVAFEGVNNQLLKNVLSSQVHHKQANDFCESHLSLNAEPLDFFLTASRLSDTYAGFMPYDGYLQEAWEYVLQNQAHDSICGCSITATHLDNENRFKRAKEIIHMIETDAHRYLSKNISAQGKGKDGAFTVLNNTQLAVNGTVEVPFEIVDGTHQWNFIFYDVNGNEVPYNIISHDAYHKRSHEYGRLVTFPKYDRFTLAMNLTIEPYSYTTLTYDILKIERSAKDEKGNNKWTYDRFDPPNRSLGSMRTAAHIIDNGKLIIAVNPNGTLDIFDKHTGKLYESMLMFEDCADTGEGWNYKKPPFDEEIVSACQTAQYRVLNDFPDYFKCRIICEMNVPVKAENNRRSGECTSCVIDNTIIIVKNSKKISITTKVDNKSVNHRLRVLFPTGFKTEKFKTLLPYDVYEWNIQPRDWSRAKEVDTLVVPNQGMASISDKKNMFSIYNKGLYEVSVADREDRAMYLTLFRSFSAETGEMEGTMGKMLHRDITLEYQIDFEKHNNNSLVKNANAFKIGLASFGTALLSEKQREKKALPPTANIVKIEGGAVLSSLSRNAIRIYDTGKGCKGTITLPAGIQEVHETNLAENTIIQKTKVIGNSFAYELKQKQVKTFALKYFY